MDENVDVNNAITVCNLILANRLQQTLIQIAEMTQYKT